MEIRYNLDEEDYLAFNSFHVRSSKMIIKALRVQQFLGPVIFFLVPVVFAGLGDESFPALMFIFLLASVLWVWLYPKFFWRSVMSRTKKALKEGKNEGVYGPHSMWLTEEGVREVNTKGESSVIWSGIEQLKEDKANFYLYTSAFGAYILPKNQLADEAAVRQSISVHMNKEQKTAGITNQTN